MVFEPYLLCSQRKRNSYNDLQVFPDTSGNEFNGSKKAIVHDLNDIEINLYMYI